jgi:hypothetical protein
MIEPEEREAIINEAVERAIRLTPDLARQLVVQRISEDRLKLSFLEKLLSEDSRYKRWVDVIKTVVQRKEGLNPGNLQKALEEAIPEIKKTVQQFEQLDFKATEKPSDLSFKKDDKMGQL